jgi:hypothetical protein
MQQLSSSFVRKCHNHANPSREISKAEKKINSCATCCSSVALNTCGGVRSTEYGTRRSKWWHSVDIIRGISATAGLIWRDCVPFLAFNQFYGRRYARWGGRSRPNYAAILPTPTLRQAKRANLSAGISRCRLDRSLLGRFSLSNGLSPVPRTPSRPWIADGPGIVRRSTLHTTIAIPPLPAS